MPKLDIPTLLYVADMLEKQGFPRAAWMLNQQIGPLQAQAIRDAAKAKAEADAVRK